ncbi:MAG: C4-type zinc ribbon domain-containing protein [Clostridia bacterium]|nr:C4-type zinc ribbon domain-containing protein [Clostridia bacterium]
MSKLDTVLHYQEVARKKLEIETALRASEAFRACMKLQQELKQSQATAAKLSAELENNVKLLERLTAKANSLNERTELENDDWNIMKNDEESTAAEMNELFGDMDQINKDMNTLSREIKKLFAEVDKAMDEYQKTGSDYKAAKKRYDECKATVEQERAEANGKIAEIDAELAEIAKDCDAQLLEKYKRAAKHYPDALVPVDHEKCSGCKMSIPLGTLKKLEAEGFTIECENCGRVLYSPAPQEPQE